MTVASGRIRLVLSVLLAGLLAPPASAEVSVVGGNAQHSGVLLMAITDHPDPVGTSAWRPYSSDLGRVLNPSGFTRGDGSPDIAAYPADGKPVAVWAYNTGGDHDIVLSEWTGTSWQGLEFLTASLEDELDPKVIIEDNGTVHVVWWVDGTPDRVFLSSRLGNFDTWSAPLRITATMESGRRPSLVVHEGVLLVAYERDSMTAEGGQEIVVVQPLAASAPPDVVATTQRTDRLDVMIHSRQADLWLDWKHGGGEFGRAVAGEDGWGSWSTETWIDPTWIGVEEVRSEIRSNLTP